MGLYYIKQHDENLWYGIEYITSSKEKRYFKCSTAEIPEIWKKLDEVKQNYAFESIEGIGVEFRPLRRKSMLRRVAITLMSCIIFLIMISFVSNTAQALMLYLCLILITAIILGIHLYFLDTKRSNIPFEWIDASQVIFNFKNNYNNLQKLGSRKLNLLENPKIHRNIPLLILNCILVIIANLLFLAYVIMRVMDTTALTKILFMSLAVIFTHLVLTIICNFLFLLLYRKTAYIYALR